MCQVFAEMLITVNFPKLPEPESLPLSLGEIWSRLRSSLFLPLLFSDLFQMFPGQLEVFPSRAEAGSDIQRLRVTYLQGKLLPPTPPPAPVKAAEQPAEQAPRIQPLSPTPARPPGSWQSLPGQAFKSPSHTQSHQPCVSSERARRTQTLSQACSFPA